MSDILFMLKATSWQVQQLIPLLGADQLALCDQAAAIDIELRKLIAQSEKLVVEIAQLGGLPGSKQSVTMVPGEDGAA